MSRFYIDWFPIHAEVWGVKFHSGVDDLNLAVVVRDVMRISYKSRWSFKRLRRVVRMKTRHKGIGKKQYTTWVKSSGAALIIDASSRWRYDTFSWSLSLSLSLSRTVLFSPYSCDGAVDSSTNLARRYHHALLSFHICRDDNSITFSRPASLFFRLPCRSSCRRTSA